VITIQYRWHSGSLEDSFFPLHLGLLHPTCSRQTQTDPKLDQYNNVDFRHRTLGCLILFLDFLSVCTGTLVRSPIVWQIEMRFLIKLVIGMNVAGNYNQYLALDTHPILSLL